MGSNFSAVIEHNLRNKNSLEKFLEDLISRTDLFPTIHKLTNHENDQWEWIRELDIPISFGIQMTSWVKDLKRKVEEAKLQKRYKYSNVWEELISEDRLELSGPDSILEMKFNIHILELYSYIRWRSFLMDMETQSILRNVCKELCSYFDTNYCIYMSDEFCATDSIYEGKSMSQYREELMRRFGQSKQTIDDMYIKLEDSWTTEGYFIEYF
ncbi:hypothetical protein PAT3040_05167 [Paenibacillus agaridevorans]|uniref:Uncharacterized protein n=1 Tax=Paenibacillus agaridevorans TaxID=171404 RepID=A0A2R5F3D4_9BACL|nr:hypothetical protein [Paenibacillus agaridevorans]GBG10434.1 hypothetical protein PAT3040_05167 [Paenibacillus agaridevorans]